TSPVQRKLMPQVQVTYGVTNIPTTFLNALQKLVQADSMQVCHREEGQVGVQASRESLRIVGITASLRAGNTAQASFYLRDGMMDRGGIIPIQNQEREDMVRRDATPIGLPKCLKR